MIPAIHPLPIRHDTLITNGLSRNLGGKPEAMKPMYETRLKMKPFNALPPESAAQPTQMAEAMRNLQHAVAQCHDAIFVTDHSGVITRVNPAFEKLSGYAALEIIGKDLSYFTEGGSRCVEYQQIWREIFEQKAHTGVWPLRTKAGHVCALEINVTAVRNAKGTIISLVGTAHVLTPEVKARPSARSSSEDTSRIGHDLRNALMLALANADIAAESLPAEHCARRNLANIRNAVQRAVALLQLLTNREIEDHSGSLSAPVTGGKMPIENSSANQEPPLLVPSETRNGVEARNKSATVLLVEDEPLIRQATAEFLSDSGYNVLAAGSGEEALEQLKEYKDRLDLVITDLLLPKMSGPQLAESVRTARPGVKVLFISGHSQATALGGPAGKQGPLIAKPFSFPILQMKVREMLAQKARAHAAGSSE